MDPGPPSPSSFTLLSLAIVGLAAYLMGSVPTGAIVARLYRNVDLTRVGSERTGATNVTRTMGVGAGLIVLLGDLAKGALAVWLAQQIVGSPWSTSLAGFLSVVGHNRSVFLRGRGGRGVATGLGGLSIASTSLFIVACLTGCVVTAASRYVSLGSICGALAAAIGGLLAYATGNFPGELVPYILATPAFIIAEHSDNIARLRAGTERRLGMWD